MYSSMIGVTMMVIRSAKGEFMVCRTLTEFAPVSMAEACTEAVKPRSLIGCTRRFAAEIPRIVPHRASGAQQNRLFSRKE